jgi:hypothetical protein
MDCGSHDLIILQIDSIDLGAKAKARDFPRIKSHDRRPYGINPNRIFPGDN